MKQLFIPHIGTKLELTASWVFTLKNDGMNEGLARAAGLMYTKHYESMRYDWKTKKDELHEWDSETYDDTIINLQKGTILAVTRLNVKQGNREWDSIVFKVIECPIKKYKKKRLHVRLDELKSLSALIQE